MKEWILMETVTPMRRHHHQALEVGPLPLKISVADAPDISDCPATVDFDVATVSCPPC